MKTFELVWITLLAVTAGYGLHSLCTTCGQAAGNREIEYYSHYNIAEKACNLDTITLASLDTNETIPEDAPAAGLSLGSELSIHSLVYLCIDLGYLLVFTLLIAGVVKFLGVFGFCISKGKGGK